MCVASCWVLAIGVVGVVLMAGLRGAAQTKPAGGLERTVISLGAVATGDSVASLTVSPDGRHLAYVAAGKNGKHVVMDGVAGPEFRDIPVGRLTEAGRPAALRFSLDGTQLGYVAMTEQGAVLVVDGNASGAYEGIAIGAFAFSPDGKRVGFIGQREKKEVVVCEGAEGGMYDSVSESVPRFSGDGKHLFYEARKGDHSVIVMDGKEIAEEEFASNVTFSADGKRMAFVTRKGAEWRVVVDGVAGRGYLSVGNDVKFSADGRHVLYQGRRRESDCLVIDGVEVDEKGVIREGSYGFDARGEAFCIVERGRSWFAVRGREEFGPYEGILGSLIFSADGGHFAFATAVGKQRLYVVDGKEGALFDDLSSDLEFSAKGGHWFYPGVRGKGLFLVRDGEETACEEVHRVVYSGDGRHVVVDVRQGGKEVLTLDGKELPAFDVAYGFAFNADGSELAYVGHVNGTRVENEERGGKDVLVVDGRVGEAVEEVSLQGFVGEAGVVAVVRRGGEWRVRVGDGESAAVDAVLSAVVAEGKGRFHVLGRRGGEYVRMEMVAGGK